MASAFALAAALTTASCTVSSDPTAGVAVDERGEPLVVVPECPDERMGSVQVADLGGPVRWRAVPEGPDVETPSIIPVGRPPAGLRDVDPLDGPLDPHRAYVATVSWSTPPRTVEVEFRPGSLLPGRVATEGGLAVAEETFADEADRRCIGGWLWVFGGIVLALAVVVVAVIAIGIVVVARIARARRSDADDADEVDLDELSDR